MNYFLSMSRLLMFDNRGFYSLTLKGRQYACLVNVGILGLLYGICAAFFSHAVLMGNGFDTHTANYLKIIIAGLPTAFLMHAGAALFVWVFLKAVGGKAALPAAYFDLGGASIALWILAPFVAALQTGIRAPWLLITAICLGGYAILVIVSVLKKTFDLSTLKMIFAGSATVIYIRCFLYLWV